MNLFDCDTDAQLIACSMQVANVLYDDPAAFSESHQHGFVTMFNAAKFLAHLFQNFPTTFRYLAVEIASTDTDAIRHEKPIRIDAPSVVETNERHILYALIVVWAVYAVWVCVMGPLEDCQFFFAKPCHVCSS